MVSAVYNKANFPGWKKVSPTEGGVYKCTELKETPVTCLDPENDELKERLFHLPFLFCHLRSCHRVGSFLKPPSVDCSRWLLERWRSAGGDVS